jgi:hypothetical protein
MRHLISIITILLVAGPLRAQLHCEQPIANLGEVRSGPACTHRYLLVNTGAAPLDIVGVRRDCGCLEPVLEKRALAPGEQAALELRVRTLGQPEGQRSWLAWVQYREGADLRELRLTLLASLRNEVTVQPAQLALHVEKALQQEILVTDRRTPGLRLTAVHASTPALKATLQPQGDGVTRVLLEVSAADLAPGQLDATLDLYSDDPYYRQLQVPVTLTRADKSTVSATPSVVRLQPSTSQPVCSQLVRLRPSGDDKVLVDTVEADAPGITCTWAAGPDNGVTLKIRVDSRLAQSGTHLLRVQLAGRETLTIPVVIDE